MSGMNLIMPQNNIFTNPLKKPGFEMSSGFFNDQIKYNMGDSNVFNSQNAFSSTLAAPVNLNDPISAKT